MDDFWFWFFLIILIAIACFLAFILGILVGSGDGVKSIESHQLYLKRKEKKHGGKVSRRQ